MLRSGLIGVLRGYVTGGERERETKLIGVVGHNNIFSISVRKVLPREIR